MELTSAQLADIIEHLPPIDEQNGKALTITYTQKLENSKTLPTINGSQLSATAITGIVERHIKTQDGKETVVCDPFVNITTTNSGLPYSEGKTQTLMLAKTAKTEQEKQDLERNKQTLFSLALEIAKAKHLVNIFRDEPELCAGEKVQQNALTVLGNKLDSKITDLFNHNNVSPQIIQSLSADTASAIEKIKYDQSFATDFATRQALQDGIWNETDESLRDGRIADSLDDKTTTTTDDSQKTAEQNEVKEEESAQEEILDQTQKLKDSSDNDSFDKIMEALGFKENSTKQSAKEAVNILTNTIEDTLNTERIRKQI